MRRLLQLCAALCLSLSCVAALAQDHWPSRTVTLVVPFPAGGNADIIAREIAQALQEKLGQTVIVENRSGAGGNIGGAFVAKAKPDGYTFLFATPAPAALNKLMYASMQYDPAQDFAPVVLVSKSPLIVVAKPGGFKTLKELLDFAKANPGKVNIGHPGKGTLGHITTVFLQKLGNVRVTDVPYRGTAPLMTDLLGGHIDVAIDFMTTYVPLVKENKLNALAVTTTTPSFQLPAVPTATSVGLPGFDASAWYAVLAPKDAPKEAVDKVNAVVNAWLKSETGQKSLRQNGMDAIGGSPADLKAFIDNELTKWAPLIKDANIRL
ncbi:MAG: tripartite tricarboxylate transporter substrate binding protein [Proteobacteria bacterium]|nr:tripartite tricarboxylate transporter substrate binding protein [Pseudomonadota bacterium]